MILTELRIKLSLLLAETPLTVTHVAALAEVLLPVPETYSLAGQPVTEDGLTTLLGEAESTIQNWRIAGQGGGVRYRAGDVRAWLNSHAAVDGLPVRASRFEEDGETYEWGDPFPAIMVGGRMTGFFSSLDDVEVEPDGYRVLRIATPVVVSYSPASLTRDQFDELLAVVGALGHFDEKMQAFPVEAKEIFDSLTGQMTLDARLLFLHMSLGRPGGVADHVLNTVPKEMRQQRINPAEWLYRLWQGHGFCSLDFEGLKATLFADGIELNRNALVAERNGDVRFHGTVGHLLADTTGTFFQLQPPEECQNPFCHQAYIDLLNNLLKDRLLVDKPNRDRLTPRTIGERVHAETGSGWFKSILGKYELKEKLDSELPVNKYDDTAKVPIKL